MMGKSVLYYEKFVRTSRAKVGKHGSLQSTGKVVQTSAPFGVGGFGLHSASRDTALRELFDE